MDKAIYWGILKILTLSSCSEQQQFTWNYGLCVDLYLIVKDESNQKYLTPPPVGKGDKQIVKIMVDVFSIRNIQVIESSVDFQFILNFTCLDSRLTYRDLHSNRTNKLNPSEIDWIWSWNCFGWINSYQHQREGGINKNSGAMKILLHHLDSTRKNSYVSMIWLGTLSTHKDVL